jgi:hypothetical protein
MPNDEKNNFKNPILRNISQKNNWAEKFLLATREIKKKTFNVLFNQNLC